MPQFKRFAIYYAPEPGPLASFGAHWLGWDMAAGRPAEHPELVGMDVSAITATPRKYGFHGTIKPPFRLTDGKSLDDLDVAVARLCTENAAVHLRPLTLTRVGGFLALTVSGDTTQLSALAATIVRDLDVFRAPLNDAELARRRQHPLSPDQDRLLELWGYPYVMEEFRFHITLTSKLPRAVAERTRKALEPLVEPLLSAPFVIKDLCLVGEDDLGRFHLIRRHPLLGQTGLIA